MTTTAATRHLTAETFMAEAAAMERGLQTREAELAFGRVLGQEA